MVNDLGVVSPLGNTSSGTHRSSSGEYRSSSNSRSSERGGSHSGGRSEDSVSHHLCCFLLKLSLLCSVSCKRENKGVKAFEKMER